MQKSPSPLPKILNLLDSFCYPASVLAIIGIVFLTIIHLDYYGQYRTFLKGIQDYAQTYTATISSISEDYIFLDVFNQPGAGDYYFARTQYIPKTDLPTLAEGMTIEIFAVPEADRLLVHEPSEVVLKPYYPQFLRYTGYITRGPWVAWLICLLIVSIHPEFLYLGFNIDRKKIQPTTKEQPL